MQFWKAIGPTSVRTNVWYFFFGISDLEIVMYENYEPRLACKTHPKMFPCMFPWKLLGLGRGRIYILPAICMKIFNASLE